MTKHRALRGVPAVASLAVSALLVSCAAIFGITEGTSDDGGANGDVDGGPDADLCASPCETEGVSRCQNGGVETCTRAGECLGWLAVDTCTGGDAARLCCAGTDGGAACVAADESNCYACGTSCANPTPRCLPVPKRCGCSVAFCAPGNQGCDPTSGQCAACPAVDPSAEIVFVEGTTFAGPATDKGSATCPFKTVEDALTFAKAHPSVKTVKVAAGTYAVASAGPLEVRGIALVGDGSAKTTLRGIKAFDHSVKGGTFNSAGLKATILAGHPTKETRIEGFTLEPGDAPPTAYDGSRFALFCDEGNITAKDPSPVPEPNTIVRDVTVAKNYGIGLEVTSSSTAALAVSSGCNAKVLASQFLGGLGHAIQSVAAGTPKGGDTDKVSCALVVGGPAAGDGVLMADYRIPATGPGGIDDGTGVYVLDGTIRVVLENSIIRDLNYGVYLGISDNPARSLNVRLTKNQISNIGVQGLGVNCNGHIDVLEDNVISGVSQKAFDGGAPALAIALQGGAAADCSTFPYVGSARRNRIIGNDVGLAFIPRGADPATISLNKVSDFGTAASAGANVFRCNSGVTPNRIGTDVRMDVTKRPVVVSAVGNLWDHVPPSKTTTETTNGTDLVIVAGDGTGIDSSSAGSANAEPCPEGRVPGP